MLQMKRQYDRFPKAYSFEEVLPYVKLEMSKNWGKKYGKVNFDGNMVNMASDRYKCFKIWGTTCVSCGLQGTTFYLEKTKGVKYESYHFNLYGYRDGKEILMTKDHVIPKSRGGLDIIKNYRPMCYICNQEKGNHE